MSAQDSLGSSPRDRLLRSSRRFHPRITRRAKWIMAMGLLFSMTMIYFIILPALNKFHAENYEANPAELRTSDPESLRDKSSSRKMTFSNPSKGIVHFYWWNQDKAQDEWMASLDPDQTRTFHAIDVNYLT